MGPWHEVSRQFRRSKSGMAGLFLVVFFLLIGFFAPVLANGSEHPLICRYDGKLYAPAIKELFWNVPGGKYVLPNAAPFSQVTFNFRKRMKAERGDWGLMTPVPYGPNSTSSDIVAPPSSKHLLGTDGNGRDVLSRMIHGARISLLVGFVSVGISTSIGLVLGALAGFFGGWVDTVISRIIEIVICFPTFFLILSILVWLPPSIWNVMIVIGITAWTSIARFVRGEFLRLKTTDFATAAVALGARPSRIIFRHVLPNALAPVFVPVSFGIAGAILVESALSYLGLGVQPPDPSWGSVLREGFDNIFTSSHMIAPPCLAIFAAVLAYNLIGDRLREAIDPRLRGSR
jgi:peptide/nickel transport system permease protein